MAMSDDAFAALPPIPESVVIGGERLDITPLKLGELPAFARAVRPIAAKISADPNWLAILSDDGESAIAALAIASRKPVEWVSGLSLDEAIKLAEVVFGANADFFIRRVVPEITRASQSIGTRIPGQMLSSGSSGQGTGTMMP